MSRNGAEVAAPPATPKGWIRRNGRPLRFPKSRKCLSADCLTVTPNLGGLCGDVLNATSRWFEGAP